MDGIQRAKARGVVFGRSKHLTPVQVAELQERRQQGVLIRTLMQDYRISKATVHCYLHEATEHVPEEIDVSDHGSFTFPERSAKTPNIRAL